MEAGLIGNNLAWNWWFNWRSIGCEMVQHITSGWFGMKPTCVRARWFNAWPNPSVEKAGSTYKLFITSWFNQRPKQSKLVQTMAWPEQAGQPVSSLEKAGSNNDLTRANWFNQWPGQSKMVQTMTWTGQAGWTDDLTRASWFKQRLHHSKLVQPVSLPEKDDWTAD